MNKNRMTWGPSQDMSPILRFYPICTSSRLLSRDGEMLSFGLRSIGASCPERGEKLAKGAMPTPAISINIKHDKPSALPQLKTTGGLVIDPWIDCKNDAVTNDFAKNNTQLTFARPTWLSCTETRGLNKRFAFGINTPRASDLRGAIAPCHRLRTALQEPSRTITND